MSIESILSGITNITDGGNNTASEFRDVLTDMTVTLSGDTGDTGDYITGTTFNISTGDLTSTRLLGGAIVTNLDDRYSLTGHTHLDNRIIVTQSNVATTLGGVIDGTKEYFLDGMIDLGTIEIDVPVGGINIKGYDFNTSGLFSNETNYTMFTSSSGSGDVLWNDFFIQVSGATSQVLNLTGNTGVEAFEISRINFNDCTSLGTLKTFRQGLETGTGRFGGTPQLTLDGSWIGGYFIDTSIVRNLDNGSYALYCSGDTFSMISRFRSNQNIDLPTGTTASFINFGPSNFPNSSTIQLDGCLITRGGETNAEDASITPNLTAGNLACNWRSNNGLSNTYVGGNISVLVETTTSIGVANTWYDLEAGTWLPLDLQHFEYVADGKLKHTGSNPRDFEVSSQLVIEGGANDSIAIKFRKWDDSASTFIELEYTTQTRVVNNLQGGTRDVAYFVITTGVTLDRDDYLITQVRNNNDTSDVTAELGSYMRIQER